MVGFVGSDGQDDITHHCTVLCRYERGGGGRGREGGEEEGGEEEGGGGREGEVICRVFIKQDTHPLCIWQSYSALTCS